MKFELPRINQTASAAASLSVPQASKEIKGLHVSWPIREKNDEGKKIETAIVRCLKIGQITVYQIEEIEDGAEPSAKLFIQEKKDQQAIQNPINRNRYSIEELRLRFFSLLEEGKNWLEIKTILNKAVTYPVMREWTNNPDGGANTTK